WHGAGDRCARAVAAGWTGSRAGGRSAVVGPGWSGTGAWTSYARRFGASSIMASLHRTRRTALTESYKPSYKGAGGTVVVRRLA
ncbi:MAG: hypothetical protein ACK58T_00815, partial [Phycisphaerae bacterium]